jgi:hypothetical protein
MDLQKAVIIENILRGKLLTIADYYDIITAEITEARVLRMLDNPYNAIPPKERLANILRFVDLNVPFERGTAQTREAVIKTLIKLLVDKIRVETCLEMTQIKEVPDPYGHYWHKYFMKPNGDAQPLYHLIDTVCCVEPPPTLTIDLAVYPVIPLIWRQDRFHRALAEIGEPSQPWLQDVMNHQITVWLPMGVAITTNGNHSIAAGCAKKTGVIHINADPLGERMEQRVYDITPLYKEIYFDGECYRWSETAKRSKDDINAVAGEAVSHDFGCIFELGRLLIQQEC